ncbi:MULTISPECIES: hypothetical protein [unclassified Acinetobacter]|uniref:hypothetical protein n=1 Tax=unclassified Acinetobacter TaxID=196816 RepID=UPI0029353247|nr:MULTISPECIES: hypothetical protein [unclassified Acinetobacter]WOE31721.1 hypothetical protein QSG84_00350 [Acinetobacter sp. SAAs470]WOE37188.1 hypothetical protein QSG86_09395 [Acinetobacter sp. SAAs474]
MKKLWFCSSLMLLGSSSLSYAADLSWGDPHAEAGQFSIAGAIRTRYQHKDFSDDANEGTNGDWKLADLKLVLNYENPNWLAQTDVRCYQYDRLCDAVFLHSAWVGYKLNDQQTLSAGLQSTDFGFGRFWGSSYYETLFNTLGYEDVHNLGLRYKVKHQDYSFTLGFYPTDGGNFKGISKDSSRYTGNFVEADDLDQGTHIKERNMWVTRLAKNIQWGAQDSISSEIGGSFWYSDLKNKKTDLTGHKRNWNIFSTTNYQDWQLMLLAGKQKINNKDQLMRDSSTLGAFDYAYNIANNGRYGLAEINYSFKHEFYGITGIKPYLSYSQFFKDEDGYKDSNRIIGGVAFNYKQIGIQAEYIWSRNDAMIGGTSKALAEGDNNDWNKLFYLAIGYYF